MAGLARGRVLVTGGAGFIGSALIWELNRRGITNILVSDFLKSDEKWKNLVALQFVDYIEADQLIEKVEHSPHIFTDIGTVFHLGACSSTTETDAAYLIRNNFEYTKKLAEFGLEGDRRFIYASSAATYGADASGVPENVELSTLRPLNIYGYSKHLFDCHAQRAGILQKITGLKYFNVFGPNEYHKGEMRSVVHKAFHDIQEKGTISLFKSYRREFADGEQRRDFLYVKDAVAATLYLAEHIHAGGLFNIGSGEANTWLRLANAIFAALGKEPKINFVEMPDYLRPKYQYFTCAQISKLRAAGYTRNFLPLEESVSDYVLNYLVPGKHLGDENGNQKQVGVN
jgi:ADP-L-glycero-D-manno-heptose 6-epimerase